MAASSSGHSDAGPDESLRPLTLGTAGHIDHGKTTLIKALTGRDTDRLKEEKERGISIELGFAELTLPSGRRLSVVDVPGHERFVKTMVSGATGIDFFLLVVAADDGVMPQTREHLRVIELLDIPTGMVALTKTDMVDSEMAELAKADVEEFLQTTRYPDAPIVMVSGVTGEGLPDLLATLDEMGTGVPPRPAYPATRMPVDRVFSLKGIGTVITGTLWSGGLSAENTVVILPPRASQGSAANRDVRVRSVQVHDRQVAEAIGGQRVALNLTGIDRDEVERGQWVVKDPTIEPTYLADVRLSLLTDADAPLSRVTRARVDHGTAEILAKVVLADRESLQPGESCYAQLRFEERALVYPGDHFILRSVTPVTTLGGGRVIDSSARKHGTDSKWRERLVLLEEGSAVEVAALLLEEAFPRALNGAALEGSPYLWRFAPGKKAAAVSALLADGRAVPAEAGAKARGTAGAGESAAEPSGAGTRRAADVRGARLFHGPSLLALTDSALETLKRRAQEDRLDPYLNLGDLRRDLARGREWPALDEALARLVAVEEVRRTEHGFVWAEAAVESDEGQDESVAAVLAQFESPGVPAETPTVAVAAEAAGLPPRQTQKIVDSLVRQGRLVRVGEDLYYPPDRLQSLMDRLAAAMEAGGQLTLAEGRDLLGTSRRYTQALLEHMDSEGLTLRVGDARRLRRRRG